MLKIIFLIVLFSFFSLFIYAKEDLDLETNIVLLKISSHEKVICEDPFFELLLLYDESSEEDYILLPLNMLTSYFKMKINFYRENNMLVVINSANKTELRIDLENKKYLEHDEWSREAPIVLAGDFFVSSKVLEYLFEIELDWNSRYQELTLTGDYFAKEDDLKENEREEKDKAIKEEEKVQEIIEGPDFSLGSIQYETGWEYRKNENGIEKFINENKLNVHGRIKDWAISLGGESNIDFYNNKEFELDFIKAIYKENKKFIILGDSQSDSFKAIGDKSLRGLYYRNSDKKMSRVLAYTSITGKAEEGDVVTLYVNEEKYNYLKVLSDNLYTFEHIYLKKNKINTLKVVIEKPNGEQIERVKRVAASPKIYEEGTRNFEFAIASYKEDDHDDWEGKMIGWRKDIALSENISVNWEAIVREDYNYGEKLLSSSDLGIAFRMGKNMVMDLDWYLLGNKSNFEQGGVSSLLYCLDSGYVEGTYFYLPDKVNEEIYDNTGKGVKLISVWDFSSEWSVNSLLTCYYPNLFTDLEKNRKAEISFEHQKNWRSLTKITLSAEQEDSIDQDFSDDKKIVVKDIYRLTVGKSKTSDGFRGDGELSIFDKKISFDDKEISYNKLKLRTDFYKKISDSLVITNSIEGSGKLYDSQGRFIDVEAQTESKLKLSPNDKLSCSIRHSLEGEKKFDSFKKASEELKFNTHYYINSDNIIDLGITNNSSVNSLDYRSYSLGITRFFEDGAGEVSLDIERLIPKELDRRQRDNIQLDIKKRLESKREIKFSVGKVYDIVNQISEYFAKISITHAFGFAKGNKFNQEFKDNNHISSVVGHVYLDENNNKKMDEGEKRLSGIDMILDNLRATTFEDGQFIFNLTMPGIYTLNFDFNSLDADYTPVTKEKVIRVKKNENMAFNYGLTMNGSVSGMVFIDKNANGKKDGDEEPLQWIGFTLNEKTIYTDKRGEFYFENIPLGEHSLTIIKESLPKGMVSKVGNSFKVKIRKEDLDVRDIFIPLVYNF
ncbi:hypothetical protein [Orenia metallireducens]|uniref:hypothetical protein n=1 Tax=Orenia metallireducens TaxID=1413210 RepID=UPI000BE39424|nr:hypothetical protein [Orenia metallireducens]